MKRKTITLLLVLIVSIGGTVNAQKNLADIKKDLNAPTYQDQNAVYKANLSKDEVAIGNGTLTTERYPIYAYFGYSYTQNIYLQSEIGDLPVFITHIKYYFAGTTLSLSNNWTIYMGHTTKTGFSSTSDFIPVSEMTQVYSSTFADPGGPGWIEFDITDFEYNGIDNLVIAVDENAPNYNNSSDRFYCTSGYAENRGLNWYSDTENFDPSAPGAADYCQPTIANIILTTLPTAGADITFVVDDGTNPLEGVALNFGAGDFFTDVNGQLIKYLPEGDNPWTANLFGYEEETGIVTVVDGVTQQVDITMTALPTYNANFSVEDVFANPIVNANVAIYQGTDLIDQGLTDVNGDISFNLPVGSYTYDVRATEFASIIGTVLEIVDQDVNITEVLTEVMEDPYGLMVEVSDHDAHFLWNTYQPFELYQHDGVVPAEPNAYYQAYNMGYGVVFDLSAYSAAQVAAIDFHHMLWGLAPATFQYNVHIINWDALTTIDVVGPINTTVNDDWELNVDLGDVDVTGISNVGIFIEPLSNSSSDAYPDITADNTGPDGASIRITDLSDLATAGASTVGDFFIDLWINGVEAKSNNAIVFKASKSDLSNNVINVNYPTSSKTRIVSNSTPSNTLTINEKINAPKVFESYTVYLDGTEVAAGLTNTFYDWTDLTSGEYMAGVKSVYTTGETDIIDVPFTIVPGAFITFVVDDGTNLLEGATVSVNEMDYLTDALGETEAIWFSPGDFDYTVTLFGYEDGIGTLTVEDAVNTNETISLTQLESFDVTFTVENISTELLEGANITIYFAGDEVANGTTDAAGEYGVSLPVGSYTYDVEFTGYESIIGSSFEVVDAPLGVDVTLIEIINTPTGLTADVTDNDVTLNWFEPGHTFITPQWIHWDDGVNADGIGTGAAADFDVAARFEPADITEFEGGVITKVMFFPNEAAASYMIKIWQGANAANLIYSEAVSSPTIGAMNEITLASPVTFDVSQELWIGYNVNTTTGYPAGCDATLEHPGKGNMIYWSGVWQELTVLNSALTYEWNIQGYVDAPTGKGFLGTYNVYLDDVLQTTSPISELSYDILDLADGSYTAGVKALYETGESEAVTVDFVIEGANINALSDNIIVYPNPSYGLINIKVDEMMKLEICDITGRILQVQNVNKLSTVLIENAGIYLLRFSDENGSFIRRVVVK